MTRTLSAARLLGKHSTFLARWSQLAGTSDPSGNESGLCNSAGKFGEDGQSGPSLLLQMGISATLGLAAALPTGHVCPYHSAAGYS